MTGRTVHIADHIASHTLLDVQCYQTFLLCECLMSPQNDFPYIPLCTSPFRIIGGKGDISTYLRGKVLPSLDHSIMALMNSMLMPYFPFSSTGSVGPL